MHIMKNPKKKNNQNQNDVHEILNQNLTFNSKT